MSIVKKHHYQISRKLNNCQIEGINNIEYHLHTWCTGALSDISRAQQLSNWRDQQHQISPTHMVKLSNWRDQQHQISPTHMVKFGAWLSYQL